jgi:phosphate transport system permease protein
MKPQEHIFSSSKRNVGDSLFKNLTMGFAIVLVGLFLLLFYEVAINSSASLRVFGFSFFTGSTWDPVHIIFSVLPMIYGSLASSLIALLIGVPLSIGVAVFLTELCPLKLRASFGFVIELLAAVPSVVFGIWGLLVLAPFLHESIYPVIQSYLGFIPLFQGTITGLGILTSGFILSIMIIPIVSAISRDAMLSVPRSQKEAAFALGATKWEMLRISVFSYARSGIIAGVFLGFGRAFGETMAVTMVIGNSPLISSSLFSPGYTLASLIANEFTEATYSLYTSALIEAGLALLVISFAINLLGNLLLRALVRGKGGAEQL